MEIVLYSQRKEEEEIMEIESQPMNGGDGPHSYAKNSKFQQQMLLEMENIINEEINAKLDVKSLTSSTNTFTITDLGCSVGPNTLIAINKLLKSIKQKHQNQNPNRLLEFQVFFNDQTSNDFNTLFSLLPQETKPYFAAGVPGSFHNRLFPTSSIHFAYCCSAVNWLSKVSGDLLSKKCGKIHYLGGGDDVLEEGYRGQFDRDMEGFFEARAEEMVAGGMLVMIFVGKKSDMVNLFFGVWCDCLASCLQDMVKQGTIKEEQVNTFNIPVFFPSPEHMETLIAKNGKFSIERMELSTLPPLVDIPLCVAIVRSTMDGIFTKHFGSEIANEIFKRFHEKLINYSDQLQAVVSAGINIILVVKRK